MMKLFTKRRVDRVMKRYTPKQDLTIAQIKENFIIEAIEASKTGKAMMQVKKLSHLGYWNTLNEVERLTLIRGVR